MAEERGGLGKCAGVRPLPRERQTHRRGEMRMRHGTDIGPCLVHRQVDREVGRRLRTTVAGDDDAGRIQVDQVIDGSARPCGSPMA